MRQLKTVVPVALLAAALTATSLAQPGAAAPPDTQAASASNDAQRIERNYAVGSVTSQSSIANKRSSEFAQDGVTNGDVGAGSVTETQAEPQAWWQADLRQARDVERLVIWNRYDNASRLSDFYVFTSTTPFRSTDLQATKVQPGVRSFHVDAAPEPSLTIPTRGKVRYVRIQLSGSASLSLAEVQAFGHEVIRPVTPSDWVAQNPFGMFLHYGMGTMVNAQWADPATPATTFSPSTDVDPSEWASAMKSAGMDFGVLTAKHHDGFALWPTKYSDYSVASSPYQGGHGDIVRDYVDAMRAADLKVGLYFSIWDRHNGNPVSLIKDQLRELLTQYGTIDYLWFDGWGWQIPYSTISYPDLRDFIRQLSPTTVVANNDHYGTQSTSDVVVWEVPVQGFPPTDDVRPKDASDTLDTNSTWFHTSSTGAPKSARAIVTSLNRLNNSHSLYLLNVGPDKDGHIPDAYRDRLAEIGRLSSQPLAPNLAEGRPATQSSTYLLGTQPLSADLAVDGDFSTMAHTMNDPHEWWQVDLGAAADLKTIEVYNRNDGGFQDRNTDYYVFVSDHPFDTGLAPEEQAQQDGVWTYHDTGQMGRPTTISAPTRGRYVMVQLSGTNYLSLAEVGVYAA